VAARVGEERVLLTGAVFSKIFDRACHPTTQKAHFSPYWHQRFHQTMAASHWDRSWRLPVNGAVARMM
jgi:hypothetical protein